VPLDLPDPTVILGFYHELDARNNTNSTKEFPWQFSVLTQCAWPIRWQFSSPHRNHSWHRHYTLLITKSLGKEVPWAKK